MIDRRLIVCAVGSFLGHTLIARALEELPPRPTFVRPPRIEVRVVTPPPPPPAPLEPQVETQAPIEKVVREKPRPRPKPPTPQPAAETDVEVQSSPIPAAATDTTARPKFGVTMESTSQAGRTSAPVGNSGRPTDEGPAGAGPVKPLAAVAAHEVTQMPLPQGRCAGKYTDAARAAALEGVVILDLVVDETGRAREITVVQGLGHGLTEAAIAALRACRFTPGERDGTPVPVRVRGFKIRFQLQEGP